MAKNKTIRVYPDGPVWVVKKDSASRASAIENTKEDALRAARDIAVNQGLTVIIHGKDGKIQRTVRPGDQPSDEWCFITNACTQYFGLTDNCTQLSTLRQFRDNYLLRSKTNSRLVENYYETAPIMVGLINRAKDKEKLYKYLFTKINKACAAINQNQPELAKDIYLQAYKKLLERFKFL